jgi:hypothetical protein
MGPRTHYKALAEEMCIPRDGMTTTLPFLMARYHTCHPSDASYVFLINVHAQSTKPIFIPSGRALTGITEYS